MSGGEPQVLTIRQWMDMIEKGKVQVPEFQRDFVWDRKKAVTMIEAILKDRPVGSLLGLEVEATKKRVPFQPRSIDGAPKSEAGKCELLILDGQQRLTALWHALKNKSTHYLYFLDCSNKNQDASPVGRAERRSKDNKKTWMDDNKKCVDKGYIPMHLLFEQPDKVRKWIYEAYKNAEGMVNPDQTEELQDWIDRMSERILSFKIPYLSLPDTTPEREAIQVFIESNTSAQQLRKFDLMVATMRLNMRDNLKKMRDDTGEKISAILDYVNEDDLGDLLLKIACLRRDLSPTEGNYGRPEVLNEIQENIEEIRAGIEWTCNLLRRDFIFSMKFLPSRVPLRVLPALHGSLPSDGKGQDTCRKLARKYVWRAFFTSRYTSDAALLLLSDYRGLRDTFRSRTRRPTIDILDEENYPLPDIGQIKETLGWPTRQGTFPRAILTLSLMKGARDLSNDEITNHDNIKKTEAHHIFPRQYLKEKAGIDVESNNPLNCMLIRRETNRRASNNPPLKYLSALYSKDLRAEIGESDIQNRLESHLIPAKLLLQEGIRDVGQHYNAFLRERAKLMMPAIRKLSNGEDP